jgi:hypothetical protein
MVKEPSETTSVNVSCEPGTTIIANNSTNPPLLCLIPCLISFVLLDPVAYIADDPQDNASLNVSLL